MATALPRIESRWSKLKPGADAQDPDRLLGGGGRTARCAWSRGMREHLASPFSDLDTFQRKIGILRGHCADAERDPSEIELSVGAPQGDPAEVGPSLLAAGDSLFTVGEDGPDYDLSTLKNWIDWRNSL